MSEHLNAFVEPLIAILVAVVIGVVLAAYKQLQKNATAIAALRTKVKGLEGSLATHATHGTELAGLRAATDVKQDSIDDNLERLTNDIRGIFKSIGQLQQDVAVLKREVLNGHGKTL